MSKRYGYPRSGVIAVVHSKQEMDILERTAQQFPERVVQHERTTETHLQLLSHLTTTSGKAKHDTEEMKRSLEELLLAQKNISHTVSRDDRALARLTRLVVDSTIGSCAEPL